ncbi:MAG: thioredoxin [Planctomycetaceae bacterium]|nr:thioredoxin [Planctomycetaceae bacterium]
MSDTIQVIESEESFAAAVQSGVVLIDFFATWCRPCRMQLPILEEVAAEFAGRAKIIKVDTEKLQGLTVQHGVSSIPTLIVMKDGQKVTQFAGLQQASVLKNALEQAIAL